MKMSEKNEKKRLASPEYKEAEEITKSLATIVRIFGVFSKSYAAKQKPTVFDVNAALEDFDKLISPTDPSSKN